MMLPFKKGPFHLAVAAQLPIIPIVCENYSAAYSAQTRRFNGGDLVIKGAFASAKEEEALTRVRARSPAAHIDHRRHVLLGGYRCSRRAHADADGRGDRGARTSTDRDEQAQGGLYDARRVIRTTARGLLAYFGGRECGTGVVKTECTYMGTGTRG